MKWPLKFCLALLGKQLELLLLEMAFLGGELPS